MAAVVARGLTAVAVRAVDRPGSRWRRDNHAGDPVTLGEGPAVVAGALAGLLVDRRSGPVALSVAGAGAVGLVDDLYGGAQAKGFRGHLRALREGRVTTGLVKIAGVGLTALVATTWVTTRRPGRVSDVGRAVDVVVDTALVAGTANLTNLLDLRPGRAGKASLLLGGGLAGLGTAPLLGATVGALPADLRGRAMLGDCGANALGAGIATTAVAVLPRWARLLALVGVAGLNAASERVSFTAVIERTPWLRALDRAGRGG